MLLVSRIAKIREHERDKHKTFSTKYSAIINQKLINNHFINELNQNKVSEK